MGDLNQATRGFLGGGGSSYSSTLTAIAVAGLGYVDVIWSSGVNLTALGGNLTNWSVTNTTGHSIVLTGVQQVNGTTTRLTTTDQTVGGAYVLNVPAVAVFDAGSGGPNTPMALNFVGVGHLPSLVSAVPITVTQLLVTFSEPVDEVEATTVSNYAIDKGITVQSVTHTSGNSYTLTTSPTTAGTIYTVTVHGIHDLAGNPVT